jgi:hypothetical protein
MDQRSSDGARRVPLPGAGLRRLVLVVFAALLLIVFAALLLPPAASALKPEVEEALRTSTYVYIASKRKDGSFGAPAEIWFMYHQGAVWVASPTTTWRVRRIRAGRPKVRIFVGKTDGSKFKATGSIVADPSLYDEMYRTFARKYPEGWPKYEQRFREGLTDGTRVLIKYEPVKNEASM